MVPDITADVLEDMLERAVDQTKRLVAQHERNDAATIKMIENALSVIEAQPRMARDLLSGLLGVLKEGS